MLNRENYFSPENNLMFMGSSQFKDFASCEAAALARIRGEWAEPESTAMLVGSYIDAHFEGTLDIFRAQHPDIFKRDGSLKADYEQANQIIQRLERDEMFMRFMAGEKQVIQSGKICGVPVKIRIDSFHPGKAIVDLKIMRDFKNIWDSEERTFKPFVQAWGYDIQAALYQAIEGNKLPFYIAGATKERETDLAIISIPQEALENAIAIIEANIERYDLIKKGIEEPERCGKCDYCKATKVLTEIVDFREVGL